MKPKNFFRIASALLFILLNPGVHAQLRIDFNDRSNDFPADTHEDFDAFVITANGGNGALLTNTTILRFGTITVSAWGNGGNGLDDRKRSSPANSGAFTEEQLLKDFIF